MHTPLVTARVLSVLSVVQTLINDVLNAARGISSWFHGGWSCVLATATEVAYEHTRDVYGWLKKQRPYRAGNGSDTRRLASFFSCNTYVSIPVACNPPAVVRGPTVVRHHCAREHACARPRANTRTH